MFSLPTAALNVFVVFFILTLPLRLIIYYAKSYKVVIMSRRIADWILLFLTVGATVSTATAFLFQPLQPDETIFFKYILPASGAFIMSVPYFHILSWIVGRKPFYTKNHLQYLEYFIVYLRSFNDDRKNNKLKRKMTKALADWFPVYAIGKPDEFMPPPGAKRIYVDEDWQEIVQEMVHRSKLILHRINTSENYLWEFEQCFKNDYLQKSVFWVDNIDEYNRFVEIIHKRFGLAFPYIEDRKCHVVFYYRPDWTFRIIYLTTKHDYHHFQDYFEKDHHEIFESNKEYLYARKNKLAQLLKVNRDQFIPNGVQQWSWTAFWLPEFYIICQQVKYRIIAFFVIIGTIGSLTMTTHSFENAYRVILFRVVLMFVMGYNGRKLVWLSRHWESIRYFVRQEHLTNIVVQILGIIYIIFWVVVTIIIQFI